MASAVYIFKKKKNNNNNKWILREFVWKADGQITTLKISSKGSFSVHHINSIFVGDLQVVAPGF